MKNEEAKSAKPWIKFTLLVLFLGAVWYLGKDIELTLEAVRDRINAFPIVAGFAVFVGLYAFVSIAPMAGRDIFKLVGATAWGWIPSTLLILAGEMIAAAVSFGLSRLMGKQLVDRLFGSKLAPMYEKLNSAGFRNVVLLRVAPFTPYRFLNFAAGVTDLPFGVWMLASLVGTFIRTLFFQGLFAYFAEEMIARGLTVGQVLTFSIVFAVSMLALWSITGWIKQRNNASRPTEPA